MSQQTTQTTVAGWGADNHGQAGIGAKGTYVTTPARTLFPAGVSVAKGGYDASAALMLDGTVQMAGGSQWGEQGQGTHQEQFIPAAVAGITDAVQVAVGGAHILALHADGTVSAWGGNTFLSCGVAKQPGKGEEGILSPVKVPGIAGAVAVFAGGGSSGVLMPDGTLVVWGENRSGQLTGSRANNLLPTKVVTPAVAVRKVVLSGVGGNGGQMFVLYDDGTVQAKGKNTRGQLGLGRVSPTEGWQHLAFTDVLDIAASEDHALVLFEDGSVAAMGANDEGQCGTTAAPKPEESILTPARVLLDAPAESVAAGFRHSHAVAARRLYSFGSGEHGRLGLGDLNNYAVPALVQGLTDVLHVEAGEFHGLALVEAEAPPAGDTVRVTGVTGGVQAVWTVPPGNVEPFYLKWGTGLHHSYPGHAKVAPNVGRYAIRSTAVFPVKAGERVEVGVMAHGGFGTRIAGAVAL